MNYANNAANVWASITHGYADACAQIEPKLSAVGTQLAECAEQAALLSDRVNRFLTRCHGPAPEAVVGKAEIAPGGHFNRIDGALNDLRVTLRDMSNRIDALDSIG